MNAVGVLGIAFLGAATASVAACRQLGSRVFGLGAGVAAATFVWMAWRTRSIVSGQPVTGSFEWVPELGLGVDIRIDAFSALWVLLISGIAAAVFVYSIAYFSARSDVGGFAAALTVFTLAMVGIVVADNLWLLFVCWELTSVCSYLLIGFDNSKPSARSAARQALLVTGAGGLAMLAGFVLLGQAAGTYSLSAILVARPAGPTVDVAAVLILVGAFTKSAQLPFHGWLPAAMAAPTPVSAFLHSATMVKAGIYVLARFAPAFAGSVELWRPVVLAVGLATMVFGAAVALRQSDLKLVLAYGTVSQLGLLTVLFGVGSAKVTVAAIAMLVAHGLFKAALFLVVGVVDRTTGTRDIAELSGLRHRLRGTFVVACLAGASMIGLAPLAGFVAKEKAFDALLHGGFTGSSLALVGVVGGSALTAAYGIYFLWGAFARTPAGGAERGHPAAERIPVALFWPIAVLGTAGLALGLSAGPFNEIAGPAADAIIADAGSTRVSLWAGFNTALALSGFAVGLGGLVFIFVRANFVRSGARPQPTMPSWSDGFEAALAGTARVADRVTAVIQNGSLPLYLGVILAVTVAMPLWQLGGWGESPADLVVAESWLQGAVAVGVAFAATATAVLGQRFAAALAVGAVGYGIAVLFVMQGATDLALTQFLIETLTVVALVLVLRHLPETFPEVRWRAGRAARLIISAAVGATVVALALAAGAARIERPISDVHTERALTDGGGRNVVNVILTDFRALDTLGEIIVLGVGALGVSSITRGLPPNGRASSPGPAGSPLLRRLAAAVVPAALVFSIYLLFAGHNAPGGGFVGGLVAGAALSLVYATDGQQAVSRLMRFGPVAVLSAGIGLAVITAVAGLAVGGQLLESAKGSWDLPLLGTIKVTSALPFDVGVYLVVVAVVATILTELGNREVAIAELNTERTR